MIEANSWKNILINTVILVGLTLLGGFAVGLFLARSGGPTSHLPALALSNFFMLTLGFFIAGMRTKGTYWKQLSVIAVLVWLFGITNVLLLGTSVLNWIASILACFLFMGIGGGLALLVRRRPASSVGNSA